ncbi:major facilitator superfamily domain-containing protein [Gautieria morchelliformis]|nr:major facilitator superfamily domain-containing protein [Gautieria morchelliformis]
MKDTESLDRELSDEKVDNAHPATSLHSSEADDGYDLFWRSEHLTRDEKTDSLNREHQWEVYSRQVLKKIDRRVLPIMCIVYCLQSMDKQGLNYSNIFGFQKSLHLIGQQYSWVASIFYFGYLVSQYPLAWLMQRLPMGKFLGVTVFLWSVVLMSTAGCKDFTGAMINRFVLGCLEAAVTPAFVLMTGMWYTSAEQPFRQLSWFSFQSWASTIGALIGYAVGHINGGLARWTYVFLILGAITALFSVVVYVWLPDSPVKARFLSEQERVVAVKRVASNKTGIKNKHFKAYQIRHALVDPKTYLLFLLCLSSQIPNGLLTSFKSQIIQEMGFGVLQTTLLGIPGDFVQGLSLLAAGYAASRFPNCRVIAMTIGNVTCIIASACMAYLPLSNQWGRLVAFWFTSLQSVGFSLGLAMVSLNMGGYTKKSFTGATLFVAYCVGNIIGPFFVFPSQAPRYISAIQAMLAGYVIKTAMGLLLGIYMLWENRRRDRSQATSGIAFDEHEGQRLSMLDRTEFENPHFRYSL